VTDEDDTTFSLLQIDVDESTVVDAGDEFLNIGGTDFQLDAASDLTTVRFDIERSDSAELNESEVQAILAATAYRNDSPLPTETDRVFQVSVNDGDVDGNLATSIISVVRDVQTATFSITGPPTVIDGNNVTLVVELSDTLRVGETAFVNLGLANIDTDSADLGTLNAAVTAAVTAYAGPGSLTWNGTRLTFTSDGTGALAPLSIVLPTTPDGTFEGNEDFQISLANPGSSTGQAITIDPMADEVVTTIVDNTPAPTLMIDDAMAVEGSPVVFELTLDLPSFEAITVDLTATAGSATAGADFETTNFEFFDGSVWVPAVNGTEVTIPAGQTSLMVRIDSVQEGLVEPDETFTLSANVLSGSVTNASDTGAGTIINDDVPQIFTVSLDQPPLANATVNYATASGTAISGVDFTATSGVLTFAPGIQTQTVTVAITDDNLFEGAFPILASKISSCRWHWPMFRRSKAATLGRDWSSLTVAHGNR